MFVAVVTATDRKDFRRAGMSDGNKPLWRFSNYGQNRSRSVTGVVNDSDVSLGWLSSEPAGSRPGP